MSVYFAAYCVTPDMGLRQAIDTMLSRVAYAGHDFGYLPSALHQANHERLGEDFAPILVDNGSTLALAPIVSDSDLLASLAAALDSLYSTDYPAYDDERVLAIEHERLIEAAAEALADMVSDGHEAPNASPEAIAYALHEIGACIEQSEYGANFSQGDFDAALALAEAKTARAEHEANGLVPMF